MITDIELLRRYAGEGSEEAFAALVHRHVGLVYSAALRQLAGDEHLAKDVTQWVFSELAKKASSLLGHVALPGWLYSCTYYRAAKAVRAERRRKARELKAHTMNAILSADSRDEDWNRLRPVLDEAMHALKERERETVLLRFFEKLPFAEVGERMGLSENTAAKNVERALESLRVQLARRGITSTTGALTVALADKAVATVPAGLARAIIGPALAAAGGSGIVPIVLKFMTIVKSAGIAALVVGSAIAVYETRANATLGADLEKLRGENLKLVAQYSQIVQANRELKATIATQQAEFQRSRPEVVAAAGSIAPVVSPAAQGPTVENQGVQAIASTLGVTPQSVVAEIPVQEGDTVQFRGTQPSAESVTALPTPEAFEQTYFSAPEGPASSREIARASLALVSQVQNVDGFVQSHSVLGTLLASLNDATATIQKSVDNNLEPSTAAQLQYANSLRAVVTLAQSISTRTGEYPEARTISQQIQALGGAIQKHLPSLP